jgi:hypothetical protein
VQIPVGFDYVLVLEWLSAKDQPTGAQLHAFLSSIGVTSELIVCQSWQDVREALEHAAAYRPVKGVPAVHLETHGSDPWQGPAESIGFGHDEASGVAWAQLGSMLAPLNVAADFRLLFVSAACWGSGVIAAIGGGEHAAPFACAVGFRTPVMEGRLRDSMKELYRGLKQGLTLEESVAGAQRELEEGQEVRLEVMLELAVKVLRASYYDPATPPRIPVGPQRLQGARRVWDTWFPPYLQEHNPAYRFEVAGIGS